MRSPILGTFTFKNKEINTKIPLRIRLIKMPKYRCVGNAGPNEEYAWHFQWISMTKLKRFSSDRWWSRKDADPPEPGLKMKDSSTPMCPICGKVCEKKDDFLVKIYAPHKRYINVIQLLREVTPWNFKERVEFKGHIDIAHFMDWEWSRVQRDIEWISLTLEEMKQKKNTKQPGVYFKGLKNMTITFKQSPVTEQMLYDGMKLYELEKIARKI